MIAQQPKQLKTHCRHLNFMKTGHELYCCVFISREGIEFKLINYDASDRSNKTRPGTEI